MLLALSTDNSSSSEADGNDDFDRPVNETRQLRRLHRGERGATLVEYAMLVAMISIAAIVSLRYLGASTSGEISRANSSMFVSP
jgi:Flp pilus assembly pilin Flp